VALPVALPSIASLVVPPVVVPPVNIVRARALGARAIQVEWRSPHPAPHPPHHHQQQQQLHPPHPSRQADRLASEFEYRVSMRASRIAHRLFRKGWWTMKTCVQLRRADNTPQSQNSTAQLRDVGEQPAVGGDAASLLSSNTASIASGTSCVIVDWDQFEGCAGESLQPGMFIKYFSLYSVYIQCEGFAKLTI
jgi:hypothetical protein